MACGTADFEFRHGQQAGTGRALLSGRQASSLILGGDDHPYPASVPGLKFR